jgi:hypothetical protein
LGSVCCDGEAAITLWYESIACKTITVNGFVIVCVYIFISVCFIYTIYGIPFMVSCFGGCVLQTVPRLLFVNPGV